MSVNSSLSVNSSYPGPPPPPPPYSSYKQYILLYNFLKCFLSRGGVLTNTIVMVKFIFMLLPLNFLVLYLGFRRRRSQMSNHSDVFALHTSVMELMNVVGIILISCGTHTDNHDLVMLGVLLDAFKVTGTMCFHTVTCVEYYVAVVHPITYLGWRQGKGLRLRNITVSCVWLLGVAGSGSFFLTVDVFSFLTVSILGVSCAVISFCCVSVLCVLYRPGPSDVAGERQQADPSKLRAFYSIFIILSVLLLRFGGDILISVLYPTRILEPEQNCHLWLSMYWFYLPSNLVLPLLFLHRAGHLGFCCRRPGPRKRDTPR